MVNFFITCDVIKAKTKQKHLFDYFNKCSESIYLIPPSNTHAHSLFPFVVVVVVIVIKKHS